MNKDIFFDKKTHTYTTSGGKKLISVSQLVEKYHEPFDPDGKILKKCAIKEGISEAELKDKWEKNRDRAAEYGTSVHADLEYFIKTGRIAKGSLNDDIVRKFAKIRFEGKLFTEQILYSTDFGVAGTTDLIEFLDESTINVYDFKTNKVLRKFAFGKKTMLPPISHLPDCNFYYYTIQLSLYALILEQWGCNVRNLKIFYINEKKDIEVHPIEYRRYDALNLISHYKNPSGFEKSIDL